jgi:L-alanine-DL-glutamate epimerase-like enolase superfamily enzyme
MDVVVEELRVDPLFVRLREPFVIASARMETTRGALVRITVRANDETGRRAVGLGEAACLPPVTREDAAEVLHSVEETATRLAGKSPLDLLRALDDRPVARAGVEAALVDACARLADRPAWRWLADELGVASCGLTSLETDITLPIADEERTVALAAKYRDGGFRAFKVKVGKSFRHDLSVVTALARAFPSIELRVDANEGYGPEEAIALAEGALAAGARMTVFEQPCLRGDLAGAARVASALAGAVTVVADESVRSLADLDAVVFARAAGGVNLKLSKFGGLRAAAVVGHRAREAGLAIMCGAMVETRLGLTAMAHVAACLGGVDWVDLDTAFLLDEDPFVGGYDVEGPVLKLRDGPGFALDEASARS